MHYNYGEVRIDGPLTALQDTYVVSWLARVFKVFLDGCGDWGGSGDVALQINVTSASRTGQLPVKVEIFGSPEFEKRLEKDITHIFSQSPKISSPVESIRIIMTSQHFTSCKCCEYLSHTVEIA